MPLVRLRWPSGSPKAATFETRFMASSQSRPRYAEAVTLTAALLLVVSFLSTLGCSYDRYYADAENHLQTAGYFHALDHIAVYYPSGIALNFPGYIVGFEEIDRRLVANGDNAVIVDPATYKVGYTVERLLKRLKFKVPVVSQVLRYHGRPYGEGNCTLYSLYNNHGDAIMEPCAGKGKLSVDDGSYKSAFSNSWDALDILKEHVTADVDSSEYTHLLVAIMGLDTAQEEAIRNYKSIISSIKKNGNDSFRPLFLGITWPSFYANRWFDPLWEAMAYAPVADRADILGLSWLGTILNDVIAPLSDRIRITVIAHSFGARAATMGLCVGSALKRDGQQGVDRASGGMVDEIFGLSPAFSPERFTARERWFYENVYYKDYCPKIKRFIFTSSEHDGAFNPVVWSSMTGEHSYQKRSCASKHPIKISCLTSSPEGEIRDFDLSAKISYVDTSSLMRFDVPGTKGGAHSDIYRTEIGSLIWAVIGQGN